MIYDVCINIHRATTTCIKDTKEQKGNGIVIEASADAATESNSGDNTYQSHDQQGKAIKGRNKTKGVETINKQTQQTSSHNGL